MKITCLVENTTNNENFKSEHGLSLYIETQGKKILFDMGQSDLVFENAKKLSISLEDVELAVLSHGHYDHSGGFKTFLERNQKAPVYLSKFAFEEHYNAEGKYIGIDKSLKDNDRLIFVDDKYEINKNLCLFSKNKNNREFNLGSFGLTMLEKGEIKDDDFRHEIYLLIEESNKKVLISGCSHKGIMDITQWFKPDVLVGGFHFSKLPLNDKLSEYSKFLDKFDTDFYTCHCTGTEQYEFMKKTMKHLNYLSCGESIKI